ncbi:MAG: EamA family transporter [Thermaerobacterales bacterium]
MRNARAGILMVISGSALFGSISVITRMAYAYGAEPIGLLFVRNIIVAALLGLLLIGRRRSFTDLTPVQHLSLTGLGLLLGTFGLLYASSVQYIPASLAVMLFYTYPALVMLFTIVVQGERPSLRRLGALMLARSGGGLRRFGSGNRYPRPRF